MILVLVAEPQAIVACPRCQEDCRVIEQGKTHVLVLVELEDQRCRHLSICPAEPQTTLHDLRPLRLYQHPTTGRAVYAATDTAWCRTCQQPVSKDPQALYARVRTHGPPLWNVARA